MVRARWLVPSGSWLIRRSARLLPACALALAACAESDVRFDVQSAPDFTRPATVSVFGVFKDGRMNTEAWDELGPRLSASFGHGPCETAYSPSVILGTPALASTVDDATREDGITDELLERFANMAHGEAIVVFTLAGNVPHPEADAGHEATARPQANGGGRGRGRRGGASSPVPMPDEPPPRTALELSASVYSVRLRRSVALIAMTYTGPSIEGALAKLNEKIVATLPGSTCQGWDRPAR